MNKNRHILPKRFEISELASEKKTITIDHKRINRMFELHWHDFYEFEFALTGNGIQKINGVLYPFYAGSLILLSPLDFHELISPDSSLVLYNLRFTFEALNSVILDAFSEYETPHITRFDGLRYQEIKSFFETIESEEKNIDEFAKLKIQRNLEDLLIEIFRDSNSLKSPTENEFKNSNSPVKRALLFIQNNFRDELSLEKVASYVHLSPHYFSKLFHANTGYSFIEYLLDYRMQFAKSLLSGSGMSITDIAYSSGFNSLAHFTRMFNNLNGMSPKKYKSTTALTKCNP